MDMADLAREHPKPMPEEETTASIASDATWAIDDGDERSLELKELVRDGVEPLLDRRWPFLANETRYLFRGRERKVFSRIRARTWGAGVRAGAQVVRAARGWRRF